VGAKAFAAINIRLGAAMDLAGSAAVIEKPFLPTL